MERIMTLLPQTKFERRIGVSRASYEPPIVFHAIDQFHWFDAGMVYTKNVSVANAIEFTLPRVADMGTPSSSIIVRANNRASDCEVYFFGSDGECKHYSTWQVFSYNAYKKNTKLREGFKPGDYPSHEIKTLEGFGLRKRSIKKTKSLGVFTTEICPFLKDPGTYPDFCDRVYTMPLWGSDKLEIIAQSREKTEDETIRLRFVPDTRDCAARDIISFRETPNHRSWYNPELVFDK